MSKPTTKTGKTGKKSESSFDHDCLWRQAALKLAKCVAATLQADGKIGVGSGLVMKVEGGKRIVERWDKDFIEALAFIGIEVVDRPKPTRKTNRRAEDLASMSRRSRLRYDQGG